MMALLVPVVPHAESRAAANKQMIVFMVNPFNNNVQRGKTRINIYGNTRTGNNKMYSSIDNGGLVPALTSATTW